jgi:ribonuclease D
VSKAANAPDSFDVVETDSRFRTLVDRLADCPFVAFDTEFVSEHTYRSQLCLLQVAAPGVLAVVDTLAVRELEPFWRLLAEPGRTTIVHAGREEMGFILHAIQARPADLFDVQVAAGLVDHDYPAGYAAVVRRFLNEQASKGETRTDWRKRPLSAGQMAYAVDDVRHLERLWRKLSGKLESLGRTAWMTAEMALWQDEVEESFVRKRWRRVSGLGNLSRRELAIARELWHWRDAVAEQRDMPPKRVLRDDLIVELCKRKSADERQIAAVRGMQRSDLRHIMKGLCDAIQRGLDSPAASGTGRRRRTWRCSGSSWRPRLPGCAGNSSSPRRSSAPLPTCGIFWPGSSATATPTARRPWPAAGGPRWSAASSTTSWPAGPPSGSATSARLSRS